MDWNTLLTNRNIFRTQYTDTLVFYWRLLTNREYKVFKSIQRTGDLPGSLLFVKIFETCCLDYSPQVYGDVPIGCLISLGEVMLYLSGDCDAETFASDLTQLRTIHAGDSVSEHMLKVVLTAFPSYSMEDIESWDRLEFIERFVLAENALLYRGVKITPLDLTKITRGSEGKKNKKGKTEFRPVPLDFEQEAKLLSSKQSPLDLLEAENAEYEQQIKKPTKSQLSKLKG